ncbi:hypothetical protein KAT24_00575 [Candidatus Pacearchaeota archaeon]|nr:hypothetical protein [Candidatus Pacearchaeota archaeon]
MTKENLENLKKEYAKLQKRYGLPTFEELNNYFEVEKASENETDFLLREIRKLIAERLFNYLRFIESLLNPVNVPMFVYSIIKTFDVQEKEKLTEIYKKLAKREVELIELDIDSTEEKEAQFIKESYRLWQGIRKDVLEVIDAIKKNWDTKVEADKKDYFG